MTEKKLKKHCQHFLNKIEEIMKQLILLLTLVCSFNAHSFEELDGYKGFVDCLTQPWCRGDGEYYYTQNNK